MRSTLRRLLASPWFYVATIVVVALATIGVMVLGQNIVERRAEGERAVFDVEELSEETVDPAIWGRNFPRQYDSYLRTADTNRTRYGGSEAVSRLEADPRLLEIFAQHLATLSNQLIVKEQLGEPPMIQRAKTFIEEHQAEELRLNQVAKAVNTSTYYFVKVVKQATGLTLTSVLARVRVEEVKNLGNKSDSRRRAATFILTSDVNAAASIAVASGFLPWRISLSSSASCSNSGNWLSSLSDMPVGSSASRLLSAVRLCKRSAQVPLAA